MKIVEVNNSTVYLVSFGSGREWKPAVERLKSQATQSKRFGKIILFNENDIDTDELGVGSNFFFENPRGYGLWILKPFIVLKVLREFPDCSIVFYVDSGCELNTKPLALQKLDQYIALANDDGGLAFELPFFEENWTAEYVLENMRAKQFGTTRQLAGGIFFLKNNNDSINFLNSWLQWMLKEDSTFLKGDKDGTKTNPILKEHRFDQSLFSILWKKTNYQKIPDESFWAPNWRACGSLSPIWATRSKLRFSFAMNPQLLFAYRVVRYFLRKSTKGRIII